MNKLLKLIAVVQAAVKRLTGVDYNQSDKVAHTLLGASCAGVALLAAPRLAFVPSHWYGLLGVAVGTAFVIGLLKEVWDYYHPAKHTCDWRDLAATTLGGVPLGLIFAWPWHF